MNLANYRKEFSIFIHGENLHLARLLKETLVARGYEAHFYDSENLLRQAIYLALPHIVVLQYHPGIEANIADIKKISSEIQIILISQGADDEAMAWLAEQGLTYDYMSEPVKNPQTFAHRVDKAIEKWLISFTHEQDAADGAAPEAVPTTFKPSNLAFVEHRPAPVAQDSLIFELVNQPSETEAVTWVLKQMSAFAGKDFAFLRYNLATEVLSLRDVSFGMAQKHEGLGLRLSTVHDKEHFFKHPETFKIWTDFFTTVFSASETPFFIVRGAGNVLGLIVALGAIGEDSVRMAERFIKPLSLVMENQYQAKLLFDHMEIETRTFCLRSKAFYDRLANEISRARRIDRPVSVVSFEIRAADPAQLHSAQQIVGKILKRFTRATDFVGRISARRFAVTLTHTDLDNAARKACTLISIIQAAIEERKGLNVTVAAGVNEFPLNVTDSMSLLEGSEEAADQAGEFEVLVYRKDSNESVSNFQL